MCLRASERSFLELQLGASPVTALGVVLDLQEDIFLIAITTKIILLQSKDTTTKEYDNRTKSTLLPVFILTHWGRGRFVFWALASFRLTMKVLWAAICNRREIWTWKRRNTSQRAAASRHRRPITRWWWTNRDIHMVGEPMRWEMAATE